MHNEEKIIALLEQIQGEVSNLKAGQEKADAQIESLRKDMAHHNHYVEPLIKTVKEGIDTILERNPKVDQLETKVEDHDHRIWALEQGAG